MRETPSTSNARALWQIASTPTNQTKRNRKSHTAFVVNDESNDSNRSMQSPSSLMKCPNGHHVTVEMRVVAETADKLMVEQDIKDAHGSAQRHCRPGIHGSGLFESFGNDFVSRNETQRERLENNVLQPTNRPRDLNRRSRTDGAEMVVWRNT